MKTIDKIWDLSGIPANVEIGSGCYLELNRANFERFRSERQPGLRLGDRVAIYDWTAFNVEPEGEIHVGNDSIIAGAIFMCAERIHVGRRVVISYHATIADCDFHPRDPAARMQDAIANAPGGNRLERPPLESAPVIIEDDVSIGIGAILLKGVCVGRGARVHAGAVVTRNVAPGTIVAGNPAHPIV